MINKLIKSSFIKSSLTVFTGTFTAQLIGFAILPITSRLYTDGDFGILSLIVSISTVVSSIGTLKYEQSILLPKSDFQALVLTKISLVFSFILGIISFLILILFSGHFAFLLGDPKIELYLFVIPVLFFFNCFSIVNRNYGIRQKKFKLMSFLEIFKAIVGGVGQVLFGVFNPIALALLSGPIISSVFGNIYLYKKLSSISVKQILMVKKELRLIKLLLKRYKNFPLYNLPATMANNFVLHGQNIFIFGLFTASDLGQLSMTQKILAAPTILIGSSIANVYLSKLKEHKYDSLNLYKNFKKTLLLLMCFAFPFAIAGYFLLPVIIPFFLGDKWKFAGMLAASLVFLYTIRLVVSPLSGVMIILEKQKQNLYFVLFQLILVFTVLLLAKIYGLELMTYVSLYVISQVFFYLIFLYYLNYMTKNYVP